MIVSQNTPSSPETEDTRIDEIVRSGPRGAVVVAGIATAIVIALWFAFYFLVFMPMQRQKKQQAQMLASLQSGAEVLTTGGIVGTIISITGDMLIVRVKPDNIKLQIARSAVASLVNQDKLSEDKK